MHILQLKHSLLKKEEVDKLLLKYNISITQLPKIKIDDASLPENVNIGDVIKIERKGFESDKTTDFFRVVVL
jgi:DNA-directed RNA polymerase subunit H (RpoH/RPB5)